jgi:hypothetical protein
MLRLGLFGSAQKEPRRYEFSTTKGGDTFAKLQGDPEEKRVNVTALLNDMSTEQILFAAPKGMLMAIIRKDYDAGSILRLQDMGNNGDFAAQQFLTQYKATNKEKDGLSSAAAAAEKTPLKKRGHRKSSSTTKRISFDEDAINLASDQSGSESETGTPPSSRRRPLRRTSSLGKKKIRVVLDPSYDVQKGLLSATEQKDCDFGVSYTLPEWLNDIQAVDTQNAHIHNASRDWDLFDAKIRDRISKGKSGGRLVMYAQMVARYVDTHGFKFDGFAKPELDKLEALLGKLNELRLANPKTTSCKTTIQYLSA